LILLILLIIGVLTGILAGMLGIGGGLIFTPVLYWLFRESGVERPEVWAIGTSLFSTFASSLGGSLRHHLRSSAFLREGLTAGGFGVLGTAIGKWVSTSTYFTGTEFRILITTLLVYSIGQLIYKTFFSRQSGKPAADSDRALTLKELAVIGVSGGFIATLAGIGGGLLMVPIMHVAFKQSYKRTVSISELAIVVISAAGAAQLWAYVDVARAMPLLVGAFAGAFLGVWLHDKTDARVMKGLHAGLMVFAVWAMWG
jgi:uncharacterized membrane protein YfcA